MASKAKQIKLQFAKISIAVDFFLLFVLGWVLFGGRL
jgi:hypothetical protein